MDHSGASIVSMVILEIVLSIFKCTKGVNDSSFLFVKFSNAVKHNLCSARSPRPLRPLQCYYDVADEMCLSFLILEDMSLVGE